MSRKSATLDESLALSHWNAIEKLNAKAYNGASLILILGKLVHDLNCSNPDDMFFKVFADVVRYFKETEKGKEKNEPDYGRFD